MAESQSTSAAAQNKIKPHDVGWQFVPQYYNFVNSQPHRLHCFYNKRSTFTHGEEGEDVTPAFGQQEIHDRILQIGYDQCKVFIHSIDSQSSADGGIVILVLGELSNVNQPWRKFSQTFFLAEQPGGYFVLNDIFRYLREEVDEEEEDGDVSASEPVHAEVAQKLPEEAEVTREPAVDPSPEPAPVNAPAAVVEDTVPEEAVVAAVPDKDVPPEQEAPAVEEPTTAANPPEEETAAAPVAAQEPSAPKDASPAPAPPAPKAAQPATNGSAPSPKAAPTAPAQPAAPPKAHTWASLTASHTPTNVWGKPSAASPASAAAAAPAPKKEEKPAAAAAAPSQQQRRQSQQQQPRQDGPIDISKIQTAHCFVKLPNWSPNDQSSAEYISEAELSEIASAFGELKSVEIVKSKACAFVEFVKVESARKAVQHSLSVESGGAGGTKFPQGTLYFEARKEKDERSRAKGPRTGGQGQGAQGQGQGQGQQRQQANGGANAGRGGRGARGRGGQANQGDRQSK